MKFELPKYHESRTKYSWKRKGLKCDLLELEIIYYRYINAENCELCNKEFLTTRDRHMEHSHKTGYFRNIVCNRCNHLKSDLKIRPNNTSGYVGISKKNAKGCNQGFTWRFDAHLDGKNKKIKTSVNLEKLIKFADAWKIENNYNT